MPNTKCALPESAKLRYANNGMEAVKGCDVLVVMTEWLEFRSPDFDELAGLLKHKALFDGRNIYSMSDIE